jgi:membrane fusion protein (multidrug efflux system)
MAEMPRTERFRQTVEKVEPMEPAFAASAPLRPRRRFAKRAIMVLGLLAGTAAGAYYGYDYWTTGRFLVSTDDAYVTADSTIVAPKVSGYVAEVLVEDNQPAKAGQVLARIDDRDFRAALDQARADVMAAEASVQNFGAEINLQGAEIAQAKAQIASTQASLTFAEADAERYRDLMKTGAGTVQKAQQTEATRAEASAQLARDEAALSSAERKIAVLTTARQQADAQADRARATAHQAELNLSYTTITAAVDGTVGARSLRVGQYVTAGTQLMAVVPLHAVYVVANFKETQITDVRQNQSVEVEVDSYPGVKLKGRVDSLAPASGLEFALLPPDNATGNFTKIVQRIPVKIVFDDAAMSSVLRAGMSVEPTIDTKATVLAGGAPPTGSEPAAQAAPALASAR